MGGDVVMNQATTAVLADALRMVGLRRRNLRVDLVCRFLCGDEGEQRPSLDNVVQ